MPDMLRQGLTEAHAAKFLTAARGPANKAIGEHHHRIPQPFRYARQGLKKPDSSQSAANKEARRKAAPGFQSLRAGVILDVHHPSGCHTGCPSSFWVSYRMSIILHAT